MTGAAIAEAVQRIIAGTVVSRTAAHLELGQLPSVAGIARGNLRYFVHEEGEVGLHPHGFPFLPSDVRSIVAIMRRQ